MSANPTARRRWVPLVMGALAASLLSTTTLVVGGGLLLRPDLWVVEHIVFEGVERAGPKGLRHLADLRNGTTIWAVQPDVVARGVQRHPWVRNAAARFQWPDTVVVTVEEHVPVALLASGPMHYVDAEGVPFAPASTDDLDYPVLTGISPDLAELQPEVPRKAIRSALDLLASLEATGVVPMERVAEVHFSATRGFTVQVSGGSRILFDLEGFDAQSERLVQLVQSGVDPLEPLHIDLVPRSVAIVRPLDAPSPAFDRPDPVEVSDGEG